MSSVCLSRVCYRTKQREREREKERERERERGGGTKKQRGENTLEGKRSLTNSMDCQDIILHLFIIR